MVSPVLPKGGWRTLSIQQNRKPKIKQSGFLGNKGYILVINKNNAKSNDVNWLDPRQWRQKRGLVDG
jgi:hypothetical protein